MGFTGYLLDWGSLEVLEAFLKCFELFEACLAHKYLQIIAQERPVSQGVGKGRVWML